MGKFKFTRYNNSPNNFTVFDWVKKQKMEANTIKESVDLKPTYIQFGIRSILDAVLSASFGALTKPISKIMNLDVSNPFMVIFGVIMMIIPLVLPIVLIFRGMTFSILQISINKKMIGILGLTLVILSFFACLYFWYLGLIAE